MKFVRLVIFLLTFIVVSFVIFTHLIRTAKGDAACLNYDTRISQGTTVWTIDPTNAKRFEHRSAAFPPINLYGGEAAEDNKKMIYLTGPKNGPYALYMDTKLHKSKDQYPRCLEAADCWIGKHPMSSQARKVIDGLTGNFIARWLDNDWLLYPVVEGNQTRVYLENAAGNARYAFPVELRNNEGFATNVIKRDGHVVIRVIRNSGSTAYFWSLANSRAVALQGTINGDIVPLDLSPGGAYVYNIQSDPLNKLTILSTDGNSRVEFALEQKVNINSRTRAFWSPDERYLAMHYEENVTHNHFTVIFDMNRKDYSVTRGMGFWSKDGKAWIALRTPGGPATVFAYYADQKRTVELVQNAWWMAMLGNGQIGALVGPLGKREFIAFNMDGTGFRPLIRDFSSIRGPVLVNAGHTLLYSVERGAENTVERIDIDGTNHRVLARNSRFTNEQILLNNDRRTFFFETSANGKVNLQMMDIDGTQPITLAQGLDSIDDVLVWGDRQIVYDNERNGDLLTLRTVREGRSALEIVNLVNQQHSVLRTNLDNYDGLVQDAMTGWIKFLWRDRDGTIGQDAYTPDGVPIYRVKLLGPEWPEGHRYTGPEVSPDGDWAVLGTGTQYFSLQLAATDGSTTKVIRPSSERTSSYTWSPDSSRFAFVYYDNTSYFIDVFDKYGVELQRFVGSHDPGILTWTRCN